MKAADLTVEELKGLIREIIHEELRDLLEDPDRGRELRPELEERLRASLASTERIPFEEVKRRHNLS